MEHNKNQEEVSVDEYIKHLNIKNMQLDNEIKVQNIIASRLELLSTQINLLMQFKDHVDDEQVKQIIYDKVNNNISTIINLSLTANVTKEQKQENTEGED